MHKDKKVLQEIDWMGPNEIPFHELAGWFDEKFQMSCFVGTPPPYHV